ncbi:unnamed protein product [Sphagnum jensenii]|uniref:Core-2/I-branching beta-1,6-N-acetylglucosaminyltransferase family protein n=1 Tax=Sphagnum jensenii TaxID=128206 RepID=A0ABP1BFZ2_9BRYO
MTARNAVAVDVLEETASCDASLGKQSACTTANSRTSGRGAAAADPYLQVNVGFLSKDARTGPLIHTINFVLTFLLLATGCVLAVLTTLQSAASYFRIPAAAGTSYDPAETRSAFSPPPVNPLPLLEKIKTGELETLNIPQTRQQPNLQNTLKKMISTPADEDPTRRTNPQEKPKNSSSSLSVRLHEDMKPRSFLYHNMEDDELLHKAASMQQLQDHISCNPALQQNSTVQKYSSRRLQAKIAFLFLTREALPLQALWELYFKGHEGMYSIYVHAHPNYSFPNVSSSSVFFGRNIPSKEVEWGGLSMLDAERQLLANALLDPNNERFVLLSESCIPISNFSWAYEYITKSQHSFVDCYDDVGRVGKGRYLRIQHPGRLEPEVSLNEWRKGSQWFEMSRELAMIVVSDTKYYPKFKDILCQHEPCFIDEHYLPSVLNILEPSKLANRTLTYFVFPKHGYAPHPIQWKPEMITQEWIQTLKGQNCTYNGHREYTNCHLFARKFSPETLEPLLKLAPNIYGIN